MSICSINIVDLLYLSLSYDVVSGSEIKPCNKIDKPLDFIDLPEAL